MGEIATGVNTIRGQSGCKLRRTATRAGQKTHFPMISEDPHDFEVTVVTTLMFPRGQALRALASWSDDQDLGRDNIQLVVATNRADPEIERRVADQMRPGDRLLEVATDNEMELYDVAARAARGRWLMFTEPHVFADRDCLSQLLRHVRANELAGACVRTRPTRDSNWVARLESRLYLDDADTWTRDEDWRKFTKRGVLLSRQAYFESGGLEYAYLRFAEMALAARLRDRGLRLGYAEEAVVTHLNSTELRELTDYVREYQHQACRFARDFPGVISDVPPVHRGRDSQLPVFQLRSALSALRSTLRSKGVLQRRAAAAAIVAELPRLIADVAGRPQLAAVAAGWRYHRARVALQAARIRGDDEAMYRRFMELWRRAGDLGVAAYLRACRTNERQNEITPRDVPVCIEAAQFAEHDCSGLYPVETWKGESFRWSAPVATITVALPRRDLSATFDILFIELASDAARLYFNGRPAATCPRRDDGTIAFRLRAEEFVGGAVQYLTLIVPGVPNTGNGDPRRLGLPLVRLTVE